jgi:hypothetical protein
MPERVLKLSREISAVSQRSIAQILKVTKRTRLLAVNAQIESAHAGEAGRGFNVVAEEVKKVSDTIKEISQEMTGELEVRVTELQRLGEQLVAQVRGTRLSDLAFGIIDIIDRNLYERSCDVRWWATDSAVVDCLQNPDEETARFCGERLRVILSAYTVYMDLWVADAEGVVRSHARPESYPGVVGSKVQDQGWFQKGLATRDGNDFVAMDITNNPLLQNRPVATYATAIREGGEANGRALGVLGIFFNWEEQAQTVVERVPLSEQEAANSRVMILDSKFRIIAAHPPRGLFTETYPVDLSAGRQRGNYTDDQGRVIGYALTPGYETYKGLGWYGAIEQNIK